MLRNSHILALLVMAVGFNSVVQAVTWQSVAQLEGVALCVRAKNANNDYVAEAKFVVTTPSRKNFTGSVWIHGDEITCISFPEQFNRPSPARMQYLGGKFLWSVTVENAVVRSGEFSFRDH